MKQTDERKEFRELDADALREKITSLKDELLKLRFRNASGQLEQSQRLQDIRRSIARARTIVNEKEAAASASDS